MDTIIARLKSLTAGEGRIVGYMAYNAANECIGYTEDHAAAVGADFMTLADVA
jgi:hypothetical protein